MLLFVVLYSSVLYYKFVVLYFFIDDYQQLCQADTAGFHVTNAVRPRGWVGVKLYSSITVTLEGGEWSAARPGRTLPLGNTRNPFYKRLDGSQGLS